MSGEIRASLEARMRSTPEERRARRARGGIPAYTWNPRDGFKKVKP
jgi:hypothetical protein